MRIHLISIGNKMPAWVNMGYQAYADRMPEHCALRLQEIVVPKRGNKLNSAQQKKQEGERMLPKIPRGALRIALDPCGHQWSTEIVAERLGQWMGLYPDVALLIGGPDGLAPEVIQQADHSWSLSALTFPHPLVRVIVAEQLYRAWSVLENHPYHRA